MKSTKVRTSIRLDEQVLEMADKRVQEQFTTRTQYITNLILKDCKHDRTKSGQFSNHANAD